MLLPLTGRPGRCPGLRAFGPSARSWTICESSVTNHCCMMSRSKHNQHQSLIINHFTIIRFMHTTSQPTSQPTIQPTSHTTSQPTNHPTIQPTPTTFTNNSPSPRSMTRQELAQLAGVSERTLRRWIQRSHQQLVASGYQTSQRKLSPRVVRLLMDFYGIEK